MSSPGAARQPFSSLPALRWPSSREWALAICVSAIAVAILGHDQIATMNGVLDRGDPLFSMWRLAWVAHALADPAASFFDGNIFHPASLTVLYSDATPFTGLVASPAIWLGAPLPYVYAAVILLAFAANSVAMFVLARAVTGSALAGLVGGLIFSGEPYRFAQYTHVEMHVTFWMPLALFLLLRTMAGGSRRDAILFGAALVGQALSGLYCAAYLAASLVVLIPLWLLFVRRPDRRHVPQRLALGFAVAAAGAVLVTWPYWLVREATGQRSDAELAAFSAEPRDYLTASRHNAAYGGTLLESHGGERELFPGVVPVALSLAAFVPPLHPVAIPALGGLVFAADASLGVNGFTHGWLAGLPPFRAFRVPARFRIVVSLYLALLAALGARQLLRRLNGPATRVVGVSAVAALLVAEFLPRLQFQEVWTRPPGVYANIPSGAVVANLPHGSDENWNDPIYLYWSTQDWPELVNGYSGFEPPWYGPLRQLAAAFPSNDTLDAYRALGTQYFVLHSGLYRQRYPDVTARADSQPRLRHVTTYEWGEGEARVYQLVE